MTSSKAMHPSLVHLKTDPYMARVVERVELRIPEPHSDVYFVLLKSIVEQQLSTKAAATIWGRFLKLFDGYPDAHAVLDLPVEKMRGAGLSFQKAGYLHNIARFSLEDELSDAYVNSLDDLEAVAHLSQIKGVGRWTAEMILMFSMVRPDVFPVDDLIIRNAMVHLYDVKSEKRQLYKDLEEIAEAWRPWRSYACFLLWDYYEGVVLGRKLYGT